MLQDMDDMEASCNLYVKFGMFDQFNQIKICISTVTQMEIVMLTIQHNLIVCVSFIYHPSDVLRQRSPEILRVKECPVYIRQS